MNQPKPLRDRLTKDILNRLRTRKLSNREAAEMFSVSEAYLSRTVAAIQSKEPGKTTAHRAAAHKLAVARRQTREMYARQVKNGELDIRTAAKRANCSERTMSRFVEAYRPPKRKRRA